MSDDVLDAAETIEEAPADDLRSALNASLAEHEAKQTDAAKPPKAAEPDAPAEPATDAPERARGPDGKFIRAEGEAPPVDAPAPAAPEQPAPVPPADDPVAKATSKWSPQDREMLKTLPPDAQQFVLRRHHEMEADYTRKTQRLAGLERDYAPVDQMFTPYAETMRAKGLTPTNIIQAWANVEKQLMEGGQTAAQTISGIVNTYNIDKRQLAAAMGLTASQNPADPAAPVPEHQQAPIPPEILNQLAQQQQWIAQQERLSQIRAQTEHQQAVTRVQTDIEKFRDAVDSSGALLHPHFHDVEDDMARHVMLAKARGEQEPSLSDIYNQAVWANPSTRTQMLAAQSAAAEAQRQAAEKQRVAEARAKAEKAKRAGGSVTGGPSSGQPGRTGELTLRQQLMASAEAVEA